MVHLSEVVDLDELNTLIAEGMVRRQDHPLLPLSILNYTNKAQCSRQWTDTLKACRGLIYDRDTFDVYARPFPKFFNYGEEARDKVRWSKDEPVLVTDKLDGSLGIAYRCDTDTEPRVAIATRGSFSSEQALWANITLLEKYPDWVPYSGWTYLFEIVYPENRIVVDYDGMDDLVLLGAVEMDTGRTFGPEGFLDWPGPKAEVFPFESLEMALAAPPRPGKEGLVVHFLNSDERIKIKQDDYVRLHRIVTGLNEQTVWELMQTKGLTGIWEDLPEEFHEWVQDVYIRLLEQYAEVDEFIYDVHEQLCDHEGIRDRKTFALRIKHLPNWVKAALFLVFDDRDCSHIIWNYIKPKKEGVHG